MCIRDRRAAPSGARESRDVAKAELGDRQQGVRPGLGRMPCLELVEVRALVGVEEVLVGLAGGGARRLRAAPACGGRRRGRQAAPSGGVPPRRWAIPRRPATGAVRRRSRRERTAGPRGGAGGQLAGPAAPAPGARTRCPRAGVAWFSASVLLRQPPAGFERTLPAGPDSPVAPPAGRGRDHGRFQERGTDGTDPAAYAEAPCGPPPRR